jgi:hypothetical protein
VNKCQLYTCRQQCSPLSGPLWPGQEHYSTSVCRGSRTSHMHSTKNRKSFPNCFECIKFCIALGMVVLRALFSTSTTHTTKRTHGVSKVCVVLGMVVVRLVFGTCSGHTREVSEFHHVSVFVEQSVWWC